MSLVKRLTLYLVIFICSNLIADENEFSTNEKVYVVGDIHGAYKELVQTLTTVGLIDKDHNWTGGASHLVSLGDLLDRGPNSRAVIDLLRKLQEQADDVDGKVHVVLGNHEVMNLQGDWRYLSAKEISAFAAEETERQRDKAYKIFLRSYTIADTEQHRTEFNTLYPPGFFAHIKAYHRRGEYGRWLLRQPFIIKINNNLFTHGGLSPAVETMSIEEINEQQKDSLKSYLRVWEYFLEQQVLPFNVPFIERPNFVALTRRDKDHRTFMRTSESLVFSTNATTWYRGNALCHPFFEEDRLKKHLAKLDAKRLWVGHTTSVSKQVQTRLSGALVIMDTGMLKSYYRGQPWIAKISPDDQLEFIHGETGAKSNPLISPVRDYANPYRWSDERVEEFLKTAEIIDIEEIEEGRTNPKRLTLKDGKRTINAIFKYLDTIPNGEKLLWRNAMNKGDRYQYEMAAYKLDRMLGIGLVPVTVEREIAGVKGVVQLWVDNLTSFLEMNESNIEYDGMCEYKGQINFLDSFDYLISNVDRNQSNILFSKSDLQIWFIDHSKAFTSKITRPSMLRNQEIEITPRFRRSLEQLSDDKLYTLRPWLNKRQIKALIQRRDKMLAGDF